MQNDTAEQFLTPNPEGDELNVLNFKAQILLNSTQKIQYRPIIVITN